MERKQFIGFSGVAFIRFETCDAIPNSCLPLLIAEENIRKLALPAEDPVYAKNGPIHEIWYGTG